jgi:SPP1 gp7 family putative phage head morphogenesis protein
VTNLYARACTHHHGSHLVDSARAEDGGALLNLFTQLAQQLHQAPGKPLPLDAELTRHYNDRLQAAVTLGYEAHDVSQAEFLRTNVQLFSAAKTAHATQALTNLLLDENGKLKPWPVFKEEALGLHQQYNVNWLRAEYEHAVASAQMAARWQEFEPADLLEYQTVGDDRVRPEHAAWDGITRPADDAWWQTHYPPNGWLCRCAATVAAAGARMTPRSILPALPDPDPLFAGNVGVTGIIFPEAHPYYLSLHDGE